MAGRGPAGKMLHTRSRNDDEFRELVTTGELYGDPLPDDILPKGESWHPQTLRWWESVRTFPLLKDEPAMGWQFLIDTALMHHTMWTRGRWEFAAELRLRAAKYGATPEDRMRLKLAIHTTPRPGQPRTGQAASVTNINARRDRIGDA